YNRGNASFRLHEINYQNKRPEIDFFKSLGRLPIPTLNASWYSDENGNMSSCSDDMQLDENSWKQSYWDRFYLAVTTKTENWRWEKEKRLLLHGEGINFTKDKKSRKFHYDFSCLEGIV